MTLKSRQTGKFSHTKIRPKKVIEIEFSYNNNNSSSSSIPTTWGRLHEYWSAIPLYLGPYITSCHLSPHYFNPSQFYPSSCLFSSFTCVWSNSRNPTYAKERNIINCCNSLSPIPSQPSVASNNKLYSTSFQLL